MPETFWLSLLVIQLLMTDNASVLVRLRDKKTSRGLEGSGGEGGGGRRSEGRRGLHLRKASRGLEGGFKGA